MSLTEKLQAIYAKQEAVEGQRLKQQLQLAPSDLAHWLARIDKVQSIPELFTLLDDFRAGSWTDDQRAQVSRRYMSRIEALR